MRARDKERESSYGVIWRLETRAYCIYAPLRASLHIKMYVLYSWINCENA
jgi:hypothetical protein